MYNKHMLVVCTKIAHGQINFTSFTHQEGIRETTVSPTLHENEQMQLLFQGNPVFRTHSKCHRHLTTTIKNTCHTTYATTTTPKQV